MEDRCNVLFLGPYPPGGGAAGSFAKTLVEQLAGGDCVRPALMSVGERPPRKELFGHIKKRSRFAHMAAADRINESDADLVAILHDWDTYGGNNGEYLLDLLQRLQIPFIVVCHNVHANPDPARKTILADLCYYSRATVVPNLVSKQVLQDVYGVSTDDFVVIPKGVPTPPRMNREHIRGAYQIADRVVLSTQGYLAPHMGIEIAMEAVARLKADYPNLFYVVAGRTHQEQKRKYGEDYRAHLEVLRKKWGLQDHVIFVNRWLSELEQQRLLAMTDIYVSPHLRMAQTVCDTLAWAVGSGHAVVSTPSLCAQELLAEGRGLLACFDDVDSLAGCLSTVIDSPEMKRNIEENSAKLGREMAWPKVCGRYEEMLSKVSAQNRPAPQQPGFMMKPC